MIIRPYDFETRVINVIKDSYKQVLYDLGQSTDKETIVITHASASPITSATAVAGVPVYIIIESVDSDKFTRESLISGIVSWSIEPSPPTDPRTLAFPLVWDGIRALPTRINSNMRVTVTNETNDTIELYFNVGGLVIEF